jgi:hypothetical protein
MATVVKGFVGGGVLALGKSTWWSWKITSGDVWVFWAQPRWVEFATPIGGAFEIKEVHSKVDLDGTRWARFKIANVSEQYGSDNIFFRVYVARIT